MLTIPCIGLVIVNRPPVAHHPALGAQDGAAAHYGVPVVEHEGLAWGNCPLRLMEAAVEGVWPRHLDGARSRFLGISDFSC